MVSVMGIAGTDFQRKRPASIGGFGGFRGGRFGGGFRGYGFGPGFGLGLGYGAYYYGSRCYAWTPYGWGCGYPYPYY